MYISGVIMLSYSLLLVFTFIPSQIVCMTADGDNSVVVPFDSNKEHHALIKAYGEKLKSSDYECGQKNSEAAKNILAAILLRGSVLREAHDYWNKEQSENQQSIEGDSDLDSDLNYLTQGYESTRSFLVSHWDINSVAMNGEYFYMNPELLHTHFKELDNQIGNLNYNKPNSSRLGIMYLFAAVKKMTVVHYDQATQQYLPGLPVEDQNLRSLGLKKYFDELAQARDFRPWHAKQAAKCKLAAENISWLVRRQFNPSAE